MLRLHGARQAGLPDLRAGQGLAAGRAGPPPPQRAAVPLTLTRAPAPAQVDQGLGIGTGFPLFNRATASLTRFLQLREPPRGSRKPPPVLVAHGRGGAALGDLASYDYFTLGGPYSARPHAAPRFPGQRSGARQGRRRRSFRPSTRTAGWPWRARRRRSGRPRSCQQGVTARLAPGPLPALARPACAARFDYARATSISADATPCCAEERLRAWLSPNPVCGAGARVQRGRAGGVPQLRRGRPGAAPAAAGAPHAASPGEVLQASAARLQRAPWRTPRARLPSPLRRAC